MPKLRELEILTKQVYLNIEREEEVETVSMSTEQAISEYGELEVVSVGEPRYDSNTEAGGATEEEKPCKRRKQAPADDGRKAGTTDIILRAGLAI